MEGGVVGHNFERDSPGTIPAKFGLREYDTVGFGLLNLLLAMHIFERNYHRKLLQKPDAIIFYRFEIVIFSLPL
jgi:hypothetical protein